MISSNRSIRFIILFSFLFSVFTIRAQEEYAYAYNDTTQKKSIFDKDLTELMKIPIIKSASKKEESNIESPLSTTVITEQQIKNSGATTIEELFRLVPGIIVREQSNGNFDIHIRGNDNVVPGGFTFVASNTLTLVMIDGRKVYNNMNGGTLWETLPVSLTDIKQIEIIRGPSTALYGPNAATGVINIITRNDYNKKFSLLGNVQTGTLNTTTVNLTGGSSLNDNQWVISSSINYDHRNRGTESYYNYITEKYTRVDSLYDYLNFDPNNPSFVSTQRWTDPSFAKEKLGVNSQVTYNISDSSNTSLSATYQKSTTQSVFMENTTTPLSNRYTESASLDYKLNIKNFHSQLSYLGAYQNLNMGSGDINEYIYHTFDANIEYALNIKESIIRPGIQFQNAHYDDRPYANQQNTGILNASQKINTLAYFLRADIPLSKKLRLISALRMDHYSTPSTEIFTYQFILSYKINKDNIIRAIAAKSNRGPFIADLFADIHSGGINFKGNTNLELTKNFSYELGYKTKISPKLYGEAEVFYNFTHDFSGLQYKNYNTQTNEVEVQWQNYILESKQIGSTVSLTYALNDKTKITAFGTLQETKLKNYEQPTTQGSLVSPTDTIDIIHKNTPNFYGGAYLESTIFHKLILFTNLYAYTSQQYVYYIDNNNINGKIRVDAKLSYPIWNESSIFINGKNIFNNDSVEFGFADTIGSLYLIGVDIKL